MNERQRSPLTEKRRLGGWMPAKEDVAAAFRRQLAAEAAAYHARHATGADALLSSVVCELSELVHGDAVLRMNLARAIDEAVAAGYDLGYASIDELMRIVDYLMTYAPPFDASAPVATPLNLPLDWPMCMPSGYAVFRDPAFNAKLRRVLEYWCGFLDGPHSRTHLNADTPNGWFCDEAREKLSLDEFVCDPSMPHWGFASWNAFFTRQFRPGARPVDEPDNHKVIVSACEASPYDVRDDLKLHDRFWIKSQPHSLSEVLTTRQEALARRFVGGTVFQGYLSAFNYHRWHAPVAGTYALPTTSTALIIRTSKQRASTPAD